MHVHGGASGVGRSGVQRYGERRAAVAGADSRTEQTLPVCADLCFAGGGVGVPGEVTSSDGDKDRGGRAGRY